MCEYCDVDNPIPISSGIYINGYCFDSDLSEDDIEAIKKAMNTDDDDRYFDICVNAISNDVQEPSLIVTGDFPLTIPAARIYYCPMCGRKLD